MELRLLRTFQTVARLLSFQRSAEVLNYSPSAVSTQIRLLEKEVGVPLFDRLGKSVRLTEAGQMMLQYSQKMLQLENEALAKVAGWAEPNGSIAIRIPQSVGTYLLPAVLKEFQKTFPKVGFEIDACAYDALPRELRTGITDVAFLLADAVAFADLATEVLRIEPLVVVAGPGHRLAGKSSLSMGDMAGESILLPRHDCSYKMIFEGMLAEAGVDSVVFMVLNSIEAIKKCVLQGIGVAMIPRMSVKEEIDQKKMVALALPEENLETAVLMIWHKEKWVSPTLQAFMETVRRVMSKEGGP